MAEFKWSYTYVNSEGETVEFSDTVTITVPATKGLLRKAAALAAVQIEDRLHLVAPDDAPIGV